MTILNENRLKNERVYSVTEAANILGIDRAHLYKILNAHQLKKTEFGYKVLEKNAHGEFIEEFQLYDFTLPLLSAILQTKKNYSRAKERERSEE